MPTIADCEQQHSTAAPQLKTEQGSLAVAPEVGGLEGKLEPPAQAPPTLPPRRPVGGYFKANAVTQRRGVYVRPKGGFQALMWTSQSSNLSLGTYATIDEAALAWDAKATERGYPQSELNFPYGQPRESYPSELPCTTGADYKGVTKLRKPADTPFQAQVWNKSKNAYILCGLHATAEAAARAYDAKARELGVAEERLNFPHGQRIAVTKRRGAKRRRVPSLAISHGAVNKESSCEPWSAQAAGELGGLPPPMKTPLCSAVSIVSSVIFCDESQGWIHGP